jgi:hypothetical protein
MNPPVPYRPRRPDEPDENHPKPDEFEATIPPAKEDEAQDYRVLVDEPKYRR